MKQVISTVLILPLFYAFEAFSGALYVDLNSQNPTPPFASWISAATNIQDAIDAASEGDEIIVTNGIYQTGARPAHGITSNRVAVTKAVTVESVNGPLVTIIQGYQMPGTTNGVGSIRCAYLTNGATLSGFTLVGGATQSNPNGDAQGGGVRCEATNAVVTNCILVGNAAFLPGGGGAYGGTLQNCVISNNNAGMNPGGGAMGSILNNCILIGNIANVGAGASSSTLNGCTLASNVALGSGAQGGGAAYCTLRNCTLVGNYANGTGGIGGGASQSSLSECRITNNWSGQSGGGVAGGNLNNCYLIGNSTGVNGGGGAGSCTMDNCVLYNNWSTNRGGGCWAGYLTNCTVVGNSATNQGGGTWGGAIYNSIVYYNSAPADPDVTFVPIYYSCTTRTTGTGFTNEPMFLNLAAGNLRLSAQSPCINSGNNGYITNTTDITGNTRVSAGTVDMGAFEYQSPASIISYAWLEEYGLATDGSADYADSDGDQMNNWQEWRAGTIPTNASSVLKMLAANPGDSGITVQWQSVPGKFYYLQRATNLALQPAFVTVSSNIFAAPGTTSYLDTSATSPAQFYRVGVQ
jgi:hypothetical protein